MIRGINAPTKGLSVRRRRGRKRARGSRSPMPQALRPNQRRSMDPRHGRSDQWRCHGSISDTFGAARRFRILAVNDDCCRGNLSLIADTSIPGDRVTRELGAPVQLYGRPEIAWRQRHRVHRKGRPEMGQGQWHREALGVQSRHLVGRVQDESIRL